MSVRYKTASVHDYTFATNREYLPGAIESILQDEGHYKFSLKDYCWKLKYTDLADIYFLNLGTLPIKVSHDLVHPHMTYAEKARHYRKHALTPTRKLKRLYLINYEKMRKDVQEIVAQCCAIIDCKISSFTEWMSK